MWQDIILSIIGIIFTIIVTFIIERLTVFINCKIKNSKTLKYTTDAIEIIFKAVKTTYQTYVEELKNKNMFNADAQKIALNKAIEQVQKEMSDDIKLYIKTNFGDINEWIENQIEAALYDLKNK